MNCLILTLNPAGITSSHHCMSQWHGMWGSILTYMALEGLKLFPMLIIPDQNYHATYPPAVFVACRPPSQILFALILFLPLNCCSLAGKIRNCTSQSSLIAQGPQTNLTLSERWKVSYPPFFRKLARRFQNGCLTEWSRLAWKRDSFQIPNLSPYSSRLMAMRPPFWTFMLKSDGDTSLDWY